MLSMVAMCRRAESRSGAKVPSARHAPLNSSISAIRPRIYGVIWIVAAWIMAPSCIPNYTHLPVPQSYTFRIYSYDCIFSYMLSLTTISKGVNAPWLS